MRSFFRSLYVFLWALPFLLLACGKEKLRPEQASFQFRVEHHVGGRSLAFDNREYVNGAGNRYRVSRLEYLLSDFWFMSERGKFHPIDTVLYVNAREEQSFTLEGIPPGTYLRAGCRFGLAPEKNRKECLPNEKRFIEMAWPSQMGGGYHFMRFEGHYKKNSTWQGFALHLGKDGNSVRIEGTCSIELQKYGHPLTLRMDLNEWFRGAGGVYDLASDPVYSMSDDHAMARLARNGRTAFEIRSGR